MIWVKTGAWKLVCDKFQNQSNPFSENLKGDNKNMILPYLTSMITQVWPAFIVD